MRLNILTKYNDKLINDNKNINNTIYLFNLKVNRNKIFIFIQFFKIKTASSGCNCLIDFIKFFSVNNLLVFLNLILFLSEQNI